MKNTIAKLWEQELLPIKDAIYFSNGESHECRITTHPVPSINVGEKFSLDDFNEHNKQDVCAIDIFKEIPPTTGGYCCTGGCSYGSDGFIAYLDNERNLVWAIYSSSSNPFIDAVQVDDRTVKVTTTTNLEINIDLESPLTLDLTQ
ncbi:hypothetical protein KX924_06675 [Streptomyces sp. II-2-2-2]